MTIQDAMIKVSQRSPEHLIEFGSMKREELKAAVEVDVRAFESYEYITNYFHDPEGRVKAIRDMFHCSLLTSAMRHPARACAC